MKIEIYLNGGEEEKEEDMPRKPTAFHRKVAKMLAQKQGRKTPNDMDLKKAMDLDEENED